MTEEEIKAFFEANPAVFYKVYAKPIAVYGDLVRYRFPGIDATGSFVESERHILTFLPWLNIDKIEVW